MAAASNSGQRPVMDTMAVWRRPAGSDRPDAFIMMLSCSAWSSPSWCRSQELPDLRDDGPHRGRDYSYLRLQPRWQNHPALQSLKGDADLYVSDKTLQPSYDTYKLQSANCGQDVVVTVPLNPFDAAWTRQGRAKQPPRLRMRQRPRSSCNHTNDRGGTNLLGGEDSLQPVPSRETTQHRSHLVSTSVLRILSQGQVQITRCALTLQNHLVPES
ncbi:unnamed protein product [Pleuronectes platessa]|uniref:Uncharacterized protein n=1 Tax=Pleuronectes platessa TaxID=8262 RepID=A0A9N7VWD9_PLEPL|nr:unnamed protein product [Pleuronectes platessa]